MMVGKHPDHELIEQVARAMAVDGGNGGDWDDPEYYQEIHKEYWRRIALIAVQIVKGRMTENV